MLDIGNTLIPCAGVLGIVHVHDIHDHSINDLSLTICLGVEGSGLVILVSSSDQRLDQNVLRN
jgi:hypothetical protein